MDCVEQLKEAARAVQPLNYNDPYSYSCNSDEKERVYYSAKEKLRNLILSRLDGNDMAFKWVIGDEKSVLFSSPKEGEGGFVLDEFWAAIGDISSCSFMIPPSLDEIVEPDHLLEVVRQLTFVEATSSLRCCIVRTDEMDRDAYRDVVKEEVRDLLSDMYWYDDHDGEDVDGDECDMGLGECEALADFLLACTDAAVGFVAEAMGNELFASFIEGVSDMLNNVYPPEYIIQEAWMFLCPFLESNCEHTIYIRNIASKEIYAYKEYREYVPEKERERVDRAIEILDDPFPGSVTDACDFDERAEHIVTVMCDCNETWQDCSLFWKDARDYLAEVLPVLRKEYGTIEECVA
jgi:hypothetical protein